MAPTKTLRSSAERRVSQREFRLPQRQHDVDEIGVAIVQRMRGAGDRSGAPLVAGHLRRQRREILPMELAHIDPPGAATSFGAGKSAVEAARTMLKLVSSPLGLN